MRGWIRNVLIIGFLGSFVGFYIIYQVILSPNVLVHEKSRCVRIPAHITYRALHEYLVEEGIIKNHHTFKIVARLLRYDRYMKPGNYCLKSNMSNWAAVRLLRSGAQEPVFITLYDIRSKKMLSERITAKVDIHQDAFEKLLSDEHFLKKYSFNADNILTMFIPNTYEVYWTITPEKLFKRMYKEYKKFWTFERLIKAKAVKLTPIEVGILASIVRDESIKKKELPIIAGVYLRRLRNRIRLQADPTIKYILGEEVTINRVLHHYKKIDSPYNTYKYSGLPPGPVNVPSTASIDAVLNYTKHQYLYFCGKDDFSGEHYFSCSFKEHLQYARRYQRALNRARVYR